MLSGSGPDIVYTAGPSYVATMAEAGQLLALDDYAQKLGWNDRLLPLFLDLGKYNGKLYALAKTYETLGLFYNKTLFAKNGWTPPTTIAELEKLADTMKARWTGALRRRQCRLAWRQRVARVDRAQLDRRTGGRLQGADRRDAVDGRSDRQGDR